MSEIRKLIKQSSHYLVGQIAIMLAGFISFPILTRIFSVNDYGNLSLISTTILIMSAIIKFGFPNTITRFYSEYKKNNELTKFYMTILIGSSAIAAIVISLFLVITQMAGSIFHGMNITGLLAAVPLIIFAGAISDNLTTLHPSRTKNQIL